jgi:hypothetical protein
MDATIQSSRAETEAAIISRERAAALATYQRTIAEIDVRLRRLQRRCPHYLGKHIKEIPLECPTCGLSLAGRTGG